MRIVFMGTPEFAVPSLNALVRNGYEVVLAVMQKDKPRDRGKEVKQPPVKEYALSAGIPVLQPERLNREPDMVEAIRSYAPDLMVTCAFGQLLPKSLLDIPPLGTINVHGSLLPALRGAAPIQWSIINGERVTGITTMFTDVGLDTGDMLLKEIVEIPDDMTAGELHDMMSVIGAATLIKTLHLLEAGTLRRIPQNGALATLAPRFTKETGCIDWSKSALDIHNLVRGTDPWPGAYTGYLGAKMRIILTTPPQRMQSEEGTDGEGMQAGSKEMQAGSKEMQSGSEEMQSGSKEMYAGSKEMHAGSEEMKPCSSGILPEAVLPGTILEAGSEGMLVQTGKGVLRILEIQMPSAKRMRVADWINGHDLKCGTVLGDVG